MCFWKRIELCGSGADMSPAFERGMLYDHGPSVVAARYARSFCPKPLAGMVIRGSGPNLMNEFK